MLLNPIETRFATNFVMVESLFKLKLVIEQIIVDLKRQLLITHYAATIVKSC
jgi:hypothetical protein